MRVLPLLSTFKPAFYISFLSNSDKFNNQSSDFDIQYKKALAKGISDTFNCSVNEKDFGSVVAPNELKQLLKRFLAEHFQTGSFPFNNPNKREVFTNVLEGKYRINLHSHSRKSDGIMTPSEFLKMAAKYADKAKRLHPDLPPFTIALTDHNNIEGAKEILSLIAKNPDKYKNLKFVVGCEFMFMDKDSTFEFPAFEAIGLGFNPFDPEINKRLKSMNDIDLLGVIKDSGGVVSYAHPYIQGNGCDEDFIKYLISKGVNGIESNYQYFNFQDIPELRKSMSDTKSVAEKYNLFETGGTDTHHRNVFHFKAESILDELLE